MILPNNTGGFMLQTMLYLANQKPNESNFNELYNLPPGMSPADINDIKCYGVYGCFPITPPWTVKTRPVSLYPESPSRIDPHFPVFNKNRRELPKFIDINDPDQIKNLDINPRGNIYFVSHGYLESGDRPWIQNMVNALLDEDLHGTASVVVVDWGGNGASSPPYTQAVANIRLVGAITAHIIHLLHEELGLPNLDKVHMIGHSLGSHLSGYAGFTLQRDFNLTLGRITGMDPAEPLFHQVDPIVRLDRTDAKFVDIIHSDAKPFTSGGLGISQVIGHLDFFPNGGFNQPGCKEDMATYVEQEGGSFFWGVQQFVSCNHIRSHQFFLESIMPKCPFMAISCEDYESFKAGNCFKCDRDGHKCFQFGFHSYKSYRRAIESGSIRESASIQAYLMTDAQKPYCRTHYKVKIKISNSEESILHGGEIGIMSIIIKSQHNTETEKMPFSEEATFYEPGHKYVTVMPGKDVGIPKYAIVNWEYKTNPLNPLTWRVISPRVYIEYIIVESLEHKSSLRLCPMFNNPVVADTENVFRHDYC
ncbi:pancreatic triacylglycerol lipase [Sergentomyia squamirostris]